MGKASGERGRQINRLQKPISSSIWAAQRVTRAVTGREMKVERMTASSSASVVERETFMKKILPLTK